MTEIRESSITPRQPEYGPGRPNFGPNQIREVNELTVGRRYNLRYLGDVERRRRRSIDGYIDHEYIEIKHYGSCVILEKPRLISTTPTWQFWKDRWVRWRVKVIRENHRKEDLDLAEWGVTKEYGTENSNGTWRQDQWIEDHLKSIRDRRGIARNFL